MVHVWSIRVLNLDKDCRVENKVINSLKSIIQKVIDRSNARYLEDYIHGHS